MCITRRNLLLVGWLRRFTTPLVSRAHMSVEREHLAMVAGLLPQGDNNLLTAMLDLTSEGSPESVAADVPAKPANSTPAQSHPTSESTFNMPEEEGAPAHHLVLRRPDTAEKIRRRTARLVGELQEIERYRTLRTVGTGSTVTSHRSTVPQPAAATNAASRSGLFSQTMAESQVGTTRGVAGSDVVRKPATKGDGGAGLSLSSSKIGSLVDALSGRLTR